MGVGPGRLWLDSGTGRRALVWRLCHRGGFGAVFLNLQVFNDEALSLGGVLAHVEGQEILGSHALWNDDGVEADVLADEVTEFVGRDFTESFEAGNFGLGAAFLDRGQAFCFAVAIAGDFLVANAEEGGLENMEVSLSNELGEELEEEGDEEEADVHAVDVGIGRNHDVVVAEAFDSVLDIKGVLKEVEFLVFVDDFFGEAEGVEGFAFKGEDRLRVDVAGFGNGTGSGVALGDKEG